MTSTPVNLVLMIVPSTLGVSDVWRVSPFRAVQQILQVDAMLHGYPSLVPAFYLVQPVRKSRSKKDSNTRPRRSTKRHQTSTMRDRFDAAKASLGDMPVTVLENDLE